MKTRIPDPLDSRQTSLGIARKRGRGPLRFLLLPGLVPDGPETFLRQEKLLLGCGDIETMTYPYREFRLEAVLERISEFVARHAQAGRPAVLFGVSVGGGFVLEWLRREREAGREPAVAGVLLVSPMSCVGDLAPLLLRLWKPIVSRSGDSVQALEKGRSFFKSLASRSAGSASQPTGIRGLLAMLTPQGLEGIEERKIKRRIEATLEAIPPEGAIERCRALESLPGPHVGERAKGALCTAPVLILWGSKERHTLDMEGPCASVLCRPDLAVRHFPEVQVQWVYGKDGEDVPHASLLKHDKAFRRPLKEFLERLGRTAARRRAA